MASRLPHQPSITLYRGHLCPSAYVWSPFVTKLETRLRFAGLTYRTEAGSVPNAPRGKIPYVAISKSESASAPPMTLSDSQLIIEKFAEDGLLADINAGLTPSEKAFDLALRAMLEDKLYFYQVHERWHDNYITMRSNALGAMPHLLQVLIGLLAYRKVSATLYGQGTGRLSGEEIVSFKTQIWEAVNALLVKSRGKGRAGRAAKEGCFWLLGREEPTEVDTVLYGFIVSVLVCKAGPESQKIVKGFPAITDYAKRIHDHYFPDYALWE